MDLLAGLHLKQVKFRRNRLNFFHEECGSKPTYVSGSTSILGMALLNFMSRFLTLRQFLTGSTRFRRLYFAIAPLSTEILETNVMDVCGTKAYSLVSQLKIIIRQFMSLTPNMGRIIIGSTVGMEAFGSP